MLFSQIFLLIFNIYAVFWTCKYCGLDKFRKYLRNMRLIKNFNLNCGLALVEVYIKTCGTCDAEVGFNLRRSPLIIKHLISNSLSKAGLTHNLRQENGFRHSYFSKTAFVLINAQDYSIQNSSLREFEMFLMC